MAAQDKTLLLISPDASVRDAVGSALAGVKGLKVSTEASTLAGLNGKAAQMAKGRDIIVFEASNDEEADLKAVQALASARGNRGILLALADSDIPLSRVRALNKAGVDEVLPSPAAGAELGARIRELFEAAAAQPGKTTTQGRIIAVAQARGGVGATTVAVNLANALVGKSGLFRKVQPRSVALVDLDVQFGSVGALLDLPEQDTLHQLALDGIVPDAALLSQAMPVLANGMSVLPAPSKFMPLESLQPAQVAAILETLQARNDFVVVDLPLAVGSWMEPVVRRADELIIVTDTSVPAVRHCRRLIEFLTADNPSLTVRIVINHETPGLFRSSVQKEVQKALDQKLDFWLPHDPRAARLTADRGKPLSEVAPRSPLAKAIARLAQRTIADFSAPHQNSTRSR